MGCIRGDVEDTVDTGLFQRLGIRLWITAKKAATTAIEFPAAKTDKHQLDFLHETGRIVDIIHGEGSAAEETYVRKLIEVGQCDRFGFHTTHRESGHGAVKLIG